MSTIHQLLTAADFERLTFDHPAELVRGEVVEGPMPTSQHGAVCAMITAMLVAWARTHRAGVVFSNDSHIITERDPDTVRGPDCAYIRQERLPGGKLPPGVLQIPVDLAVEVLSPTDRWTEVLDKVLEYLRAGVTEVWVIDPEQKTVAVHRPTGAPLHFRAGDTLVRSDLLPGFAEPVADLFLHV
jgi:Uma2 family endonuclease